ncbi:hypothetical protein apy_04210 [Aeropyrum pernix]|uniref:DUF2118 domain-containing protein n=1 Tax=Aeropyrum pernix TaxID=56636 RepID=A0A401H898_AERPX|nr:DUF2118 domain-containing protein [Aeropyrum pernix]GBF08696.1 hypothetical protein apy_04210 [Aeropyrum pernix]
MGDSERERRGWSEEYSPEDYRFPELYIEGYVSERAIWVDEEGGKYYRRPVEGLKRYGLAVYEHAIKEAIDLVGSRVSRGFVVIIPWKGMRGLMLKEGTRVKLVEAAGVQVSHYSLEGTRVGERTVLSYVLTGKGETRTLRAGVEGVVAIILTDHNRQPPAYIYVIADEHDVIWLEPAE